MKFLIIDSHKSSTKDSSNFNLHLQNARLIQAGLQDLYHQVDLIWSYKGVNDNIESGYDSIILNHASPYSYVDQEWIERSPDANLFYLTNEYNLGEPRILWHAAKRQNRHYTVIANHPSNISKIVTKYTKAWHIINLNTLVFNPRTMVYMLAKHGCVYYGSFRKDRAPSFRRYLRHGAINISTHSKNRDKFIAAGINGPFIDRIDWGNGGLSGYKCSLYIEDEITHNNYNFLANRFYESLNYNVIPLFGFECNRTIEKSGYPIPESLIIQDPEQIQEQINSVQFDLSEWKRIAQSERETNLNALVNILNAQKET